MSAWIGPPGGLVEILQYKGGLSVSQERAQSTRTTLGGRVKVQRGPRVRREWKASTPYASAVGTAGFLALLEVGEPPWLWVDPYAQVTNLFTPEQSTLAPGSWSGDGLVEGGAVTVEGLTVPRSVSHPSGGTITFGMRDGSPDQPPVVPGVRVSVSVSVRGTGALTLHWLNWQGASIGSASQSYNHSTMASASIEGRMPPPGAVSARLVATGAGQAAMPCFTWTPAAPAWSKGRGCTRAIVESVSENVEMANLEDKARRFSALSFTVREVG